MKKLLYIPVLVILMSCNNKPSSIKVQNNLSGATMQNVEWGGVPLATSLMPGEVSSKIKIRDDYSYYDIDLPEKHQLKFYIDVKGDKVYLETKESFNLGVEDDIIIVISDSTEVYNPLLEEEQ